MVLEKQFAEFLTSQMRTKVQMVIQETNSTNARELEMYVEQISGVFDAIFAESDIKGKKNTRRGKGNISNMESS